MAALSRAVRDAIINAKVQAEPRASIAGFVRSIGWEDGKWHGDSCGCVDDRCSGGFHHDDVGEPCGCFWVEFRQYLCGLRGHVWGETREHDYGCGPVRWQLCARCTASRSVAS